ncbi:MAG: lipoate--protein ligase family protein [Dysgonamonadaceae bacterium]|nr:lipoate--protein ligase family protein [Dysgonamonadaceae bacterium]
MIVLKSPSCQPQFNSDLEKHLLERRGQDFLLFYINRPSVIVGRNQSVDAEINIDYCEANGIEIFRRISGGGAVYHDFGNINYAFAVDKGSGAALDRDFLGPVIRVLQSFGVEAVAGARRELLAGNKKISGTASLVTRDRILFHGTLLHRVDMTHLHSSLQTVRAGFGNSVRSKYVPSIPSEVMNLSAITGETETTEAFLERIIFLCGNRLQYISSESLL